MLDARRRQLLPDYAVVPAPCVCGPQPYGWTVANLSEQFLQRH